MARTYDRPAAAASKGPKRQETTKLELENWELDKNETNTKGPLGRDDVLFARAWGASSQGGYFTTGARGQGKTACQLRAAEKEKGV